MKKYKLLLFVLIAFINYSCYSYYEISQDEIQKKTNGDIVKIELNDRSEMEANVKDIKIQDSTIILTRGLTTTTIKFSDIEKFYGEKFSIANTLLMIPVALLTVSAVFIIFYFMFHNNGFSMTD